MINNQPLIGNLVEADSNLDLWEKTCSSTLKLLVVAGYLLFTSFFFVSSN